MTPTLQDLQDILSNYRHYSMVIKCHPGSCEATWYDKGYTHRVSAETLPELYDKLAKVLR